MKKLNFNEATLSFLKREFDTGMPIVVPTDTNYNFLCKPTNKSAIDFVFKLKERPKDKPLSLFVYNPYKIKELGKNYDENLLNVIIETYLPGPLNIILDKNTSDYDYMLNNSNSIALGSIKNATWRNLVKGLNQEVAMTSANISGTVDTEIVDEDILNKQMDSKLDYYLGGLEENETTLSSTIIKIQKNKITLIREGDIRFAEICDTLDTAGIIYEK